MFMKPFCDECNKLIPNINTLMNAFEKMCAATTEPEKCLALCRRVKKLAEELQELMEVGVQLGFVKKVVKKAK